MKLSLENVCFNPHKKELCYGVSGDSDLQSALTAGYSDWKNAAACLAEHEGSESRRKAAYVFPGADAGLFWFIRELHSGSIFVSVDVVMLPQYNRVFCTAADVVGLPLGLERLKAVTSLQMRCECIFIIPSTLLHLALNYLISHTNSCLGPNVHLNPPLHQLNR